MFQEVLADLEIGFGWGSMALNWINIYFSVAAWWRNVETNATLQIWEENLRNPCDSTSNLKLQTRGGQVANARWDKTGSCRATNEVDRFPASLLVEVRRDYNALKSGEFFFSGFHS